MISPNQLRGIAAAMVAAAGAVGIVTFFEGDRPVAYPDPVGIPTACYGHIDGVTVGHRYTDAQCLDLLAQDLTRTATAIYPCITVPVPTESYTAFVSFSFNAGAPAFCKSSMARKLNAGDLKGACAELSRWTYAGGRQLPGLVNRRRAERAYCERGMS